MHELALCEAVLAVAFDAAGERRIVRVKVRVGELQRVLPESWEMCWRMASMDSSAAESTCELVEAPARVHCEACGAVGRPHPPLACPECGAHRVTVVGGDELMVEEIELAGGELLRNPASPPVSHELT